MDIDGKLSVYKMAATDRAGAKLIEGACKAFMNGNGHWDANSLADVAKFESSIGPSADGLPRCATCGQISNVCILPCKPS